MRKIFTKAFALMIIIVIMSSSTTVYAADTAGHDFVDFSSDRSTYFFRMDGGDNKKIFFDFYSPFDPTVKVSAYGQLAMYELDESYYFDEDGNLMINIDDLKKLYDPYFDYEVHDDILSIIHTSYDRLIIDGFGERSTTLQYTKKVWTVDISISAGNSGTYSYVEYKPTTGGRNKEEITDYEINKDACAYDKAFAFDSSKVEVSDGSYYVPISDVMELMGKESIIEEGYLAIQQKDLADVTAVVDRDDEDVPETVVPRASNVWNPGTVGETDDSYTWACYMNDVADGNRTTGWLCRSFYIPSGSNFKDGDGNTISLEADRIVPFNIYVPSNYDENETRLTYMLHGGTGNEHTPTHRIMNRGVEVDKLAEEYNYIIVSPNGWTQNPIWREGQALYSFEKSYEMVMEEFPVKEDRIFITGNSLGGRGTLELAMRYSDIFNAFVASAPKITDKAGNKRVISIEDTKYDLSDISDMPAMIIQGTADSTTSFKTQIGSSDSEGSIVSAIMPKLNNATYVTVEQGDHSYAYGWVLRSIFDFFESTLNNDNDNPETVLLKANSRKAVVDENEIKLGNRIKVKDGSYMIALSDLEKIYGDAINVYSVTSYDSDPNKAVNYYTIIYNNNSVNVTVDETTYRINMERYKEDADIIKSGAISDEDYLVAAPQLSTASYEKSGEVFVPLADLSEALGIEISVAGKSKAIPYLVAGVAILSAAAGIALYKFKKK